MIVDQIYVARVAILEAEDDTPIATHRNGPEAGHIPFQRMKSITGQVHVARRSRLVEARQNALDFVAIGRKDLPPVAFVVEQLEPLVAEALLSRE
jgi:hypothetical protein